MLSGGYLSTFWYRDLPFSKGTFQTVTELWESFSQFSDFSRTYVYPFQEILDNFRNYGSDFHSISTIMAALWP